MSRTSRINKSHINLATDAAIPQRDLLLDCAEVARRLSAQLGADGAVEINRCERLRVKYSPGASLRVLHRIQVEAVSYVIAARTFTRGRSESAFDRARKRAVRSGALLPVARDAEFDTVYWTFPNDRKITKLSALASPPETLADICGEKWVESRIVAYAPEKCVTARCLSDRDELLAYVKIYSDEEPCSNDIYNALWEKIKDAKSRLRIPRVINFSEAHRALFLEPVAGRPIADLDKAEGPDGFRRFGIALALLHSLSVPDAFPAFERLDPNHLRKAAEVIGQARPDVAKLAFGLAEELCARRNALTDKAVCLHGDAHPKNGIHHNDSVALIDLDQAGTGPAAADIGSLLAALSYYRRSGLLSSARERELRSMFLRGYAEARELPEPDSLRWHTAAALLAERALRAVSRIRPKGLERLNDLLLDSWNLLTKKEKAPGRIS
ncbi:MAG: aminoglycoside phosphotransferase family protein [Blastocatellia bacterium]